MQGKKDMDTRGLTKTLYMYACKTKDYLWQDSSVSSLETVLANLVSEKSRNVYMDSDSLQGLLERTTLDKLTIHKICLLVETDGFARMMDPEGQLNQADINTLVVNAQVQTGLNRHEIQRLLRVILLSVGSVIDLDTGNADKYLESAAIAYVIPDEYYETEFTAIIDDMNTSSNRNERLSHDTQYKLEALAASGMPKAQYLLGTCILNGLIPDASEEVAISLLGRAAESCNAAASALLGDFYYKKGKAVFSPEDSALDEVMTAEMSGSDMWSKAFECYTGFGSANLTPERKHNVLDIYNHGIFNQRMLTCSVLLLVLILANLILALGAPVYAPHYVMGGLCFIACMGIFVMAKLLNRENPYDDVYLLPLLIFCVWSLYIGVRLFFY